MVLSSKLLQALMGPAYRLEVTATAVDLSKAIEDPNNLKLLRSALSLRLTDLVTEPDPERSPEGIGGTFKVFFSFGEAGMRSVLVGWGVSAMAQPPRSADAPNELAA